MCIEPNSWYLNDLSHTGDSDILRWTQYASCFQSQQMLLVSIVQASDWTLLPIWLETKATWKQSAAVGATGQRMQRAEVQSSPSGIFQFFFANISESPKTEPLKEMNPQWMPYRWTKLWPGSRDWSRNFWRRRWAKPKAPPPWFHAMAFSKSMALRPAARVKDSWASLGYFTNGIMPTA